MVASDDFMAAEEGEGDEGIGADPDGTYDFERDLAAALAGDSDLDDSPGTRSP